MEATTGEPLGAPATTAPPTAPIDGAAVPEEEKKDGAVEGEEDEKPKPMYERYEYLDPRKFTAICTLKISLISPQWGHLSKYELQR